MSRPKLVTTEEVAEYLGITVGALHQLRYRGKAPRAAKIGTRLRWRWSDVESWLDQQSRAAA
ncbi:helix-turn-helix transcriptional regulator [Micromonospora sp. MS34]|uniref:helix-turn-helix transcriptional regulator n=1 Tax=Micromonospora sp. MS34 TaxID=3385971 RepID=UPI0039A20858